MPFDLKYARATYQCLVNMMFKEQIGKIMEVYVDDMLVKSKTIVDYIAHLSDTFVVLRRYRMKLNQLKCSFGVAFGKFLGFISIIEESRPIQKRYKPLLTCGLPTR